MNKAILSIVFLLIVSLSIDAQWYTRSCGVSDISNWTTDEFGCMWKNASRHVVGGAITTGIGVSCIAVGLIAFDRSKGVEGGVIGFTEADEVGIVMFAVSIPFNLVGISLLIAGASRKSQLKNTPHSKGINSHSLNIAPTINRNHLNNTYSLGLTASLRF